MHLKAIDCWAIIAERENLEEHHDRAIHHTDTVTKATLTTVLHLSPDIKSGNTLYHHGILYDVRDHVVDQIEINIVTL